jgi:hypothetical protein
MIAWIPSIFGLATRGYPVVGSVRDPSGENPATQASASCSPRTASTDFSCHLTFSFRSYLNHQTALSSVRGEK